MNNTIPNPNEDAQWITHAEHEARRDQPLEAKLVTIIENKPNGLPIGEIKNKIQVPSGPMLINGQWW